MSTNHRKNQRIGSRAPRHDVAERHSAPPPAAAREWSQAGFGDEAVGPVSAAGSKSDLDVRASSRTSSTTSPVATGEKVLHWMMFFLGLGVFFMSLAMKTEGPSQVFLPGMQTPMPELCSSRMLFGVDCPGCGMTRAFISISHGQLRRAWQFNPASFVVYLLIVGQIPWQAFQLWRIRQGRLTIQSNWVYLVPTVAIVMILAQWLIRMLLPV